MQRLFHSSLYKDVDYFLQAYIKTCFEEKSKKKSHYLQTGKEVCNLINVEYPSLMSELCDMLITLTIFVLVRSDYLQELAKSDYKSK